MPELRRGHKRERSFHAHLFFESHRGIAKALLHVLDGGRIEQPRPLHRPLGEGVLERFDALVAEE